jgi:predicted HD phosphohydrolase
LVHDIGDRLSGAGGHEARGEAALRGVLGARIGRAVGLHVAAKRYLVTTDGAYRALLSPGSIHTLSLQGGDMSEAEVRAFEAEPQARDALLLRRADEAAKTPGRSVPGLDAWLPTLRTLAVSAASAP